MIGNLKKMRHCWNCGAELGAMTKADYDPRDTCGSRECNLAARDEEAAERDLAHEKLDRDMGWR